MEKQAGHHEVFFQFPLYLAAEARLKIKDHNLKDPKTNREKKPHFHALTEMAGVYRETQNFGRESPPSFLYESLPLRGFHTLTEMAGVYRETQNFGRGSPVFFI